EVTAELPGVDEKDLDVTLADGVLTVRGEKRPRAMNRTRTRTGTLWNAAMARLAGRSLCHSILTRRRSRQNLIRAYCTSTCQSRRRWRRSSRRLRSRKPEAEQDPAAL